MNIGMTTAELAKRFGDKGALEALSQAGFECVDYSGFKYGAPAHFDHKTREFAEYYDTLRLHALSLGISIHQTHTTIPSFSFDEEKQRVLFGYAVSAIYATARLGAEYIVLHPITSERAGSSHAERLDFTIGYFRSLQPYLKDAGVIGAIENVYTHEKNTRRICAAAGSSASDVAFIADSVGEGFCNCLDIGHAYLINEEPSAAALTLGNRLKVLHVHDNNGISDDHTAPFERSINWQSVVEALHDIGYNGVFNFEADGFLTKLPSELLPQRLKYLYELGKHLTSKI